MKITIDDEKCLERMLEYIEYIEKYKKVIDDNGTHMEPNDQLSDGIVYKFIQLREEAKNLSQELLNDNPVLSKSISLIIGFRNRLTHDYQNVSYGYFDEIFEHDLQELKSTLLDIKK